MPPRKYWILASAEGDGSLACILPVDAVALPKQGLEMRVPAGAEVTSKDPLPVRIKHTMAAVTAASVSAYVVDPGTGASRRFRLEELAGMEASVSDRIFVALGFPEADCPAFFFLSPIYVGDGNTREIELELPAR